MSIEWSAKRERKTPTILCKSYESCNNPEIDEIDRDFGRATAKHERVKRRDKRLPNHA
jgi:hypothetical protein